MAGARTPATTALRRAGLVFRTHPYDAGGDPAGWGAAAAAALGLDPARVFKTLVAAVDDAGPLLAVVPVAGSLDLKALAAVRGGKRATMVPPADAERITGYVTGGIAPLGTRRRLAVLVDRSALDFATVFCSAGRRGLQLELSPGDLVETAGAVVADLRA